jgi:hypothetical protein
MPLGISVTDLEIEEAIREAWAVLSAASPSAGRLAAALLAVPGARKPIRTPPMTCGATGWLFTPTRAPGWRPGGRGRESRIAGCPLPCCRKVKHGARTPMPCGAQRRGSAPMSTARAEPHENQDRVTGLRPNKLALPVPKPGGANHPHPGSNLVAARIEWSHP